MLLIHKPRNHKLLTRSIIASICIIGAFLVFSALTYTPELSHAETVIYPEKETRTMDDITYMQDITPEICQNSELNKQYTLIDKRDESDYTVARIKNSVNDESNCWMTQNLRIVGKVISWSDSDMKTGAFIVPVSDISSFNSTNQYQSKAYYETKDCGGYYNWFTATAGTGNSDIVSIQASSSICPKGWRLPAGGADSGNFYELLNGVATKKLLEQPYRFVQGGYISSSGELGALYQYGEYYSDTAHSADSAFGLSFSPSPYNEFMNFGGRQFNRIFGNNVRCIARSESTPSNNVEVAINNTISLDVTNEVEVKKSEVNPSTAAFSALVASNQPYSVSISSANPALTSSTSSTTIPSKSGLLNTAENGWGIKLKDDTNYAALTTSLQTFYTASGAEIKTIPFTIGISTAPDLPNGEYSTNITITATQN